MEMVIWNAILSAFLALLGFVLKDKADEIKRLNILISKTREEHAKDYVTKAEVHNDINRVLDRIDRLENKIDLFIREQKSALN
jgi:archaellum component FlaC